jgi:AcrR family transcriptional regulator
MKSKEMKLGAKDGTRLQIMKAALHIAETGGWASLNMRKLAGRINYTVPIIYEGFESKKGLYLELARLGFLILANKVKLAKATYQVAGKQIEAMCVACWNFAFTHKVLYQLMFGVNIDHSKKINKLAEAEKAGKLMLEVSKSLFINEPVSDGKIQINYYTYLSVIHGLLSINILQNNNGKMNQQVLIHSNSGHNGFYQRMIFYIF